MKKLLFSLTVLVFGLGVVAQADDIKITKASDTMAKVATFPDDKEIAIVPISFDSGASWDVTKDSYSVTSDVVAKLQAKKESVSIGSDGTASFHAKK